MITFSHLIHILKKYKKKYNKFYFITFPVTQTIIALIIADFKLTEPYSAEFEFFIIILCWGIFLLILIFSDFYDLIKKNCLTGIERVKMILVFAARSTLGIFLFLVFLFLIWPGNFVFIIRNPGWIVSKFITNEEQYKKEVYSDSTYALFYINELELTTKEILKEEELFKKNFTQMTESEKNKISELWMKFIDYVSGLRYIQNKYVSYSSIKESLKNNENVESVIIEASCLLSKVKNTYEIVELLNNNKILENYLNYGYITNIFPRNEYFFLKQELGSILNIYHLQKLFRYFDNGNFSISDNMEMNDLLNYINSNEIYIRELYEGRKFDFYSENFFEQLDKFTNFILSPARKSIMITLTGIEYGPRKNKLISGNEIKNIEKMLLPGDILLRRNKWQITNIGIPGFWTHSGIYTGNLQKLDEYFAGIESLDGLKFSEYLQQNYKKIYDYYNDNNPSVIESIAPCVSLTPLSNIAESDFFAALRPELSKEDIFKAIIKAYEFYQTPYDYSFDFFTDDGLICSELISKSYYTDDTKKGLNFYYNEYDNKLILYPNDIAKKFAINYGTDKEELSLVVFYDAMDIKESSFINSVEAFIQSSERSKWDF